MPEMRLTIRWPDGGIEECYSPSTVIAQFFRTGDSYPMAEFVARSDTALRAASDRVKASLGYPCARAMAQLARIEQQAAAFAGDPAARVECLGLEHGEVP